MPSKLVHGLLIVAIGLLLNVKELDLGLLIKEKVCIASGISGVILRNGQPVTNLIVRRKLSWKSEKWDEIEEIETDTNGKFSFSTRWEKIRLRLMTQPAFIIEIDVLDESLEEPIIFSTTKLGIEEYSEFDGIPNNLKCELTDEIRKVDTKYGFIGTNCYWDLTSKED